jgi:hypothetical protein
MFASRYAADARVTRKPDYLLTDLLAVVNHRLPMAGAGALQPFTFREAEAVVQQMARENKCMYTHQRVYNTLM